MPRPHGDCKFRNEWLKEDKFKSWVASDRTDNRIAKCSLCCKDIKIANAGKHALVSHLRSETHKRSERSRSGSLLQAPQNGQPLTVVVKTPVVSTSAKGTGTLITLGTSSSSYRLIPLLLTLAGRNF